MTTPTPFPNFKIAICKECGKKFAAELILMLRQGGKRVPIQKTYWCSTLCRSQYHYRVKHT